MASASSRSAPRIVYWDNIPAPYAVERYNVLAGRDAFDFHVWFARRSDSERSWVVDESTWKFKGTYIEDPLESLESAHQLVRRCDEARPDLVLALYGEPSFAAGHLLLKGLGIRTALLVLPTYDSWIRRTWWKDRAKQMLFGSADAAKVSGQDGAAHARRFGFPEDRIFPIRQSTNVRLFAAPVCCEKRRHVRERIGVEGCVFLYVGRLWNGKGLPLLFDAFRRAKQTHQAISLLLVGDGPDESALRAAASGLSGVHFVPFVQAPELPEFYAAADVFVFPTLGDPHGQVIEEAHAASLPIITSDAAGDIRTRVVDGVNGFVVPSNNPEALARRMNELAADPCLRKSMGARGAERVQAWGHDRWADDFERFVNAALTLPRRASPAARANAAIGRVAITTLDLAARTEVWRKKAHAGLSDAIRGTIVGRSNRLGMWLVSRPWQLGRPRNRVHRFGTKLGGWLLPADRLARDGVCYCAGIGEDTSLEDDLLRKTECLVWSIDPSPQSAVHVAKQSFDRTRFRFKPVGISDRTETLKFYEHSDREMLPAYSAVNLWQTTAYFEASCTTVTELMRAFGHDRLTLLKLSVEGAEWRVLTHLLGADQPDIDILCVVFTQPAPFWRVAAMVRQLRRHGLQYLCHDQWKFTFVSRT